MKVVVTGGGGFLGRAIVALLQNRGYEVVSYSRTPAKLDCAQVHGDLRDTARLREAARGADALFHVAAKAGIWGPYADYYQTNTQGTLSVLAACEAEHVPRLIYTSTPSVVHAGHSLEGITEAAPYAARYQTAYPATKALAEQAVLRAHRPGLSTVALRPHLIWGPGDPHLVPRIVAKARQGRLRRIGTHPVRVDVTYIDNAAEAHLCAFDRLLESGANAACAGRAYFITNQEPVELWDFINRILALYRLPAVSRSVPVGVARLMGALCELVWQFRSDEPPMTRFVATQLSTSHWYDATASRRDLGYQPRISMAQGLARLEATLEVAN